MAELLALAFGIYLFASFGIPVLYTLGAAIFAIAQEMLTKKR